MWCGYPSAHTLAILGMIVMLLKKILICQEIWEVSLGFLGFLADWRDIVVEKFRTVGDRGQKKDFYDLYYGVQKLGIDKIVELAYEKYGKDVNYFHLLKGITYFEDADKNPEPLLLDKSAQWDDLKKFFLNKVRDFESAFKRIKSFPH